MHRSLNTFSVYIFYFLLFRNDGKDSDNYFYNSLHLSFFPPEFVYAKYENNQLKCAFCYSY